MAVVQSTYAAGISNAVAGMIASQDDVRVASYVVEGTALAFGKPVAQGTADRGCSLVNATDDVFIGVSHRDVTLEDDDNDTTPVDGTAGIVQDGPVWVASAVNAIAAGEPAYITTAGTWTNSASGTLKAGDSRFLTSGDSGDLVIIDVRLA